MTVCATDLALIPAVLGCELLQFLVCFAQPGLQAFELIFLRLDSILSVGDRVNLSRGDGCCSMYFSSTACSNAPMPFRLNISSNAAEKLRASVLSIVSTIICHWISTPRPCCGRLRGSFLGFRSQRNQGNEQSNIKKRA